jgi:hypothetical protein
MRRMIYGWALAAGLAAGVGCSSDTEPTQPKMTDEQIKELMKQGQQQSMKERGGRKPGGPPLKQ